MSFLILPFEIDVLLWAALCNSRNRCYPRCARLPSSVWCNETSLPGSKGNASRLAVEAAENHLLKIHRFMSCAGRGLGEWWQRVGRNGYVVVIVRCATIKPGNDSASAEFRVKLPSLLIPRDLITLEPLQSVDEESVDEDGSIKVRVGLGYVLARALGESLGRKVFSGKKAKATMKMMALVKDCLVDGGRLFQIEKREWTKEMLSLVYKRWGWQGVFKIREDNTASRMNERYVVILFNPARIT